MYIVLGEQVAQSLRENFTVLELETFKVKDEDLTAFCVVDQVPVTELPQLESLKNLHQTFVDEYNKKNYNFCLDAATHLMGKFNGELDSFYQEIINKINNNT